MSREVLSDFVKYLPAKVVPALVGILAIPILTRLLPPEQYGQYLLVMASLILISSFCISWLVSVTIRFYVVYGVDSLYLICRPLLFTAILVACFIWLVLSFFMDPEFTNESFIIAGVIWLVIFGSFEYFAGWLRARNFAKVYSVALSWRSLVGLILAVIFLSSGFTGGQVVIYSAAITMFFALMLIPRYALRKDEIKLPDTDQSANLKTVLSYGVPAAFINLITVGLSMADRYIIGVEMGPEAVAIYGASYDLAEKTVFFANSMLLLSSSVIGFRIFEHEGEDKAAEFLKQLMRIYIIAAPPLVLALAILSPYVVDILLPEGYAEGAIVLPVIAMSGLFVGVMHRYSLLLSFHKRTDIIMWCSAGALITNLLCCFLMIPEFELFGAAISTTISYISWLLLVRLSALKYKGPAFPWMTLFRVTGALFVTSAVMYGVLQMTSNMNVFILLASFLSGLIAYVLVLHLSREVTPQEYREILKSMVKGFVRFE